MGLPVPAFALVDISDRLVQMNPGAGLTAGRHFGSEFARNVYPAPSMNILGKAANVWVVPDIVGFDYWIYNQDRAYNHGNLLFVQKRDTFELLVIDFSHAFWATIWSAWELSSRKGVFDGTWFSYPVYSRLVPHIKGNSPFHRFLARFAELSREKIAEAISAIPDEWGLSGADRTDMLEFLVSRQHEFPRVLKTELAAHLPNWKRGE